ncbi:thioredoxin-dependent thiol peroxidase [Kordiimonas aestuarii]|uniref:thioredoxin-dependent thiol peroxidase n=1 Tax=Kordiimonas aestuarii TaxID=1005925 RepID=UPI0021D06CF3|nr:thioredoxin-dependent thiol peroxidase [Kordiimonas aestuarii]
MTLDVGMPAPDFSLPGDNGQTITLSGYRGKKVVLYFYPKDDTPGCTTEAKDFTTLADDFASAGAVVIGMSKDKATKHDKFIAKHDLKVKLASDEDGKTIEKYGVWIEKNMYGRTYMGIERATFLIDTNGVVQNVWHKVRVKGHAEAVLNAVKAL